MAAAAVVAAAAGATAAAAWGGAGLKPVLVPSALQEADSILEGAEEKDIAFLVVGDPFGQVSFYC